MRPFCFLSPVAFLFFTLLLFPINLWLFELDKNLSIPVGCSYLLGWLVFILYITCGEWPGGLWEKDEMWVGPAGVCVWGLEGRAGKPQV